MKNRLPLPINTIKEIQLLIIKHSVNLWICNPLKNIIKDLINYEYSEAIKGINFLRENKGYSDLMDFEKNIKSILAAKKRYDAI